MRTHWLSLRHHLERTALRLQLHDAFLRAARAEEALAPFADVDALLAFLLRKDERNEPVLRALVRLSAEPRASEVATALLWLALWPGLDAIYRRRLRCVAGADDELTSSIAACFTALVRDVDLARVRRLAGTLVRSTEREVLTELRRQWRHASVHTPTDDHALDAMGRATQDVRATMRAVCDELHERLGSQDAELLLAVLVLGESQAESAARLGISPSAARKRVQRALARARQASAEASR